MERSGLPNLRRPPAGNVLHPAGLSAHGSKPFARLHSHEHLHRFTEQIALVHSRISDF